MYNIYFNRTPKSLKRITQVYLIIVMVILRLQNYSAFNGVFRVVSA